MNSNKANWRWPFKGYLSALVYGTISSGSTSWIGLPVIGSVKRIS